MENQLSPLRFQTLDKVTKLPVMTAGSRPRADQLLFAIKFAYPTLKQIELLLSWKQLQHDFDTNHLIPVAFLD